MTTTRIRGMALLTFSVMLVGTTGCFLAGVPVVTNEIPAELQTLMDNPDEFAADAAFEPADTTVGTPVDDLAGLTGCWGTYHSGRLTENGLLYDMFYEAFQFDAETGVVTRWLLTPSWLFIPPVMVVDEGTYEAVSDGRIRLTITQYTFTNLQTWRGHLYTEIPESVGVIDKLVTLSGDQLLMASPDYVEESDGILRDRVYHKFTCPD